MSLRACDAEGLECPVERAMRVISGKWKRKLLYYLYEDKQRISTLQRLIPDASRHVLTQHLRELEADGIIHREVYPETPPRVEYWPTELGHSLRPVLVSMLDWAESHADDLELTTISNAREGRHKSASQAAEPTQPLRGNG